MLDEDLIRGYLDFLKLRKNYIEASLRKAKLHLCKMSTELEKDFLSIKRASELEDAIIKAAEKRKKVYNGGYQDNGQQARFRLSVTTCSFYKWLYREGHIQHNPYPENSFRKPPRRESNYLNDIQMQSIMQNDHLSIRDICMISFLLDTGMRRDELCSTKIEDLDMKEQTVHIKYAKGEKFRTVPFTEKTKFWIDLMIGMRNKKSTYLFENVNGTKLNPNMIGNRFQEISKMVGFRINAHALRHTAGRLWAEHGVTQGIIQRFLGHDDPGMTSTYIHSTPKKLRVIQEEVNARFERIRSPFILFPNTPKRKKQQSLGRRK